MTLRSVLYSILILFIYVGSSHAFDLSKARPQLRVSTLSLGDEISGVKTTWKTLVSSSQMREAYTVILAHEPFDVGLKDGKVVYISTSYDGFTAPSGLKIGDSLGMVRKFSSEKMIKEPGWAWHVALPSGWNAAFMQGISSSTDLHDEASIKVTFFFKRAESY